ncbi:MAG: Trm112 family protein [Candidatus Omnitrophica bacterium]|nr:Trm112 family protein [Candidatus Omnitrophota bacterium]
MIHEDLLNILACPACKTQVKFNNDTLVCSACHRMYPVREGIPIMLIEEAEIEKKEKE